MGIFPYTPLPPHPISLLFSLTVGSNQPTPGLSQRPYSLNCFHLFVYSTIVYWAPIICQVLSFRVLLQKDRENSVISWKRKRKIQILCLFFKKENMTVCLSIGRNESVEAEKLTTQNWGGWPGGNGDTGGGLGSTRSAGVLAFQRHGCR